MITFPLSNKFQRQTILKVKYLLDFGNIFYIEIYVAEQCVLVKSVQPRNVKGKKQKKKFLSDAVFNAY